MGAVTRTREDGLHESTGKLEPEGQTHNPKWGPWMSEGWGLELRQCLYDPCDIDDYRKHEM